MTSDTVLVLNSQDLCKHSLQILYINHDALESLTHDDDLLRLVFFTSGLREISKCLARSQLDQLSILNLSIYLSFHFLRLYSPLALLNNRLTQRVLQNKL